MGQCDVAATWCKEEDLPSSILDEYNSKQQPHRELQSLNFSGQAAVTAVVATLSDSSDESLAKKPRTDCFDTATKGYVLNLTVVNINHYNYYFRPLTKNEGDGKHLRCQTEKEKHKKLNLQTAGRYIYTQSDNRNRTFCMHCIGILAGMRPCWIILFINELFISESLSQVYGILHEFLSRQENVLNNLGLSYL